MRTFVGRLFLLGLLIISSSAWCQAPAQPTGNTGCDRRNFLSNYYIHPQTAQRVFDDEKFFAYALRLNTAVYQDVSGTGLAPRNLQFGERVGILDPGGEGTDRIRVKDSHGQPLGWVTRDSVLCRYVPLNDADTGLYKRAVVRTDTALQGHVGAKKLYQTPEQLPADQRCDGGANRCAEVSRFQWYFIYAEENDHYLISSNANLGSSTALLMGWLPKADAYVWDTALGIRPKEEMPDSHPICAYRTMEELRSQQNCNEILGGYRWFSLDVRTAVLKQDQQAYEVLFSNAGTAGRDNITAAAGAFNRLDVFFVIDGTNSMQPVIEAVKMLTARIDASLQSKLTQGVSLRLGFRVYRDSTKTPHLDGVSNSEHLSLPKDKCDVGNEPEFKAAIANVKAADSPDDDDFPENSFGGLVQASDDLVGCPNNAKIVFVIGDHGYDPAKQQSRGFRPFTESEVASRFVPPRLARTPIVIFMQTPDESATVTNKADYNAAYTAFRNQGKKILAGIYAGQTALTPSDTFLTMASGNTVTAIANSAQAQVDAFLNPAVMQMITGGVQAGESLDHVIDRLRGNSRLNIPIRFLQYVEESLCRQLGDQCHTQVLEAVNHAYIPVTPDIIPEVLLSKDQLKQWLRILDVFKNFSNNSQGMNGRNQLVNALMTDIGNIVVVDMQSDNISLSQRIQFAAGLPASSRSWLMQYSDTDLRDTVKVPECEIGYLKQYGSKKYDILNIIYDSNGRQKPNFHEGRWPDGACPNLSEKGRNIPNIDDAVRPEALNRSDQQTTYSMMHQRADESFFWIPVNDLP